jgi:hypothetical protein
MTIDKCDPVTMQEMHRQKLKCQGCEYRKEIIEADLYLAKKYSEHYVDHCDDDDEPSAR